MFGIVRSVADLAWLVGDGRRDVGLWVVGSVGHRGDSLGQRLPGLGRGLTVCLIQTRRVFKVSVQGCGQPARCLFSGSVRFGWWFLLLVEVGEVGVDGRDVCFFVFGVVGADAGEDVQGVLPVLAGWLVLVEGVIGVG